MTSGAGHLPGIGCMVAATSLFAALDAMVKWLMADYSVVQVMFFRAAFALIPLAPWAWREGWAVLATGRPLAHVARSAIGIVAIGCFFIAFGALPLAQVTAISFAAPLLMTALSVPVLKEKVGWRRWAAVGVGFVGVLVIVRPGAMAAEAALAAALAGTVLYAVIMVLVRAMSVTERPVTIVAWFTIAALAVSGAALPWFWRTPSAFDLMLLAGVGVVGGGAQLLVTQAVRLAPVSVVAPFDYLHLLFAVGFGWAIWGDLPGSHTLAGGAIIVGAGLYVIHRERRN